MHNKQSNFTVPELVAAFAETQMRDLRVAEVVQLDMVLEDGKVESYRAKIKVSFKYEG